MAVISTFPLIDGGLADGNARRGELVARMASDLVRFDSFRDEADAIRSLYATRNYQMADIVMRIDDARQTAMQIVVAREISEP